MSLKPKPLFISVCAIWLAANMDYWIPESWAQRKSVNLFETEAPAQKKAKPRMRRYQDPPPIEDQVQEYSEDTAPSVTTQHFQMPEPPPEPEPEQGQTARYADEEADVGSGEQKKKNGPYNDDGSIEDLMQYRKQMAVTADSILPDHMKEKGPNPLLGKRGAAGGASGGGLAGLGGCMPGLNAPGGITSAAGMAATYYGMFAKLFQPGYLSEKGPMTGGMTRGQFLLAAEALLLLIFVSFKALKAIRPGGGGSFIGTMIKESFSTIGYTVTAVFVIPFSVISSDAFQSLRSIAGAGGG